MPEFQHTKAELEGMVLDLELAHGAQVFIAIEGETVLDLALGQDGVGRPARSDTLFAVYCATKPLMGLALSILAREGQVSLDSRLVDVLRSDTHPSVGELRVRDILAHRAGLSRIQGIEANFVPDSRWLQVAANTPPTDGLRPGEHAAYSEWQGWTLLGMVVESITGLAAREFIREAILNPLGLGDSLFLPMTANEFHDAYGRLGVNLDLRSPTSVPMLMERTQRVCTNRHNYAFGGYGSARGLGLLYQGLLRAHSEPHPDSISEALRACVTPAHAPAYDVVLERECRFGLGFMIDLDQHGYGTSCGSAAWGHSGHAGMSLGFADPDLDLAVGVVWNGLIDGDTAAADRRGRLVDAIYRDVAQMRTHQPAAC